jgi:hypothetical protein
MRKLNIKLIFPYNWYHYRNVKVFNDKGDLITKISHCENQNILIDNNSQFITFRLDFFKSVLKIPDGNDELFLSLFLNFRDTFPIKYFDVLKRKCLTGKFLDKEEFDKFNLDFYKTDKKWILKPNIDKSNLILGLLISISLFVTSVIEQDNEYQDLIFFISLMSLISLIMIITEKNKLLAFDYKSRMIATGFAFILGTFFLNSPIYIILVMFIFSSLFLLKSFRKLEI